MQSDEYKKHIAECYLDIEQKEFLESEVNTIIKAGPGTGKTRVLTIKAAKLLFEKIEYPQGLACITYTNKAAQELKNRLNIYGIRNRKNLFVDTIHKFCISNILYRFPFISKYDNLPKCKIIKNKGCYIDEYLKHSSIDKSNKSKQEKFLKEYKYKKYEDQDYANKLYSYYFNLFYKNNCLNFDLVLDICNEIISDDYVCKCIEAKYPYLLIDEYQDSSIAMHSLFKTLMDKTNIIFYIVGDPDQSIYGFNAASSKYYNNLYMSDNFKKIEFIKNYRTSNNISSVAKHIISSDNELKNNLIQNCFFRKCDSLEQQIEYTINNILPKLASKKILSKDICILYRDWQSEGKIINILKKNNINFVDNKKIYVNDDFKDSELIIFFEDIVLWILKQKKADKEISFRTVYLDFLKIFYRSKVLSSEKKKEIKINLYQSLVKYKTPKELLANFINSLNDDINFVKLLEQNNDEELNAYKSFCDKTKNFTIEQFAKTIECEDSVRLISTHSSKGMEFKAVIIPDLEEGRYPDWRSSSEEDLKEEKRLLFVAMTRAKEYLFLLASGYYYYYEKIYEKDISRFIKDVKFLDADEFN